MADAHICVGASAPNDVPTTMNKARRVEKDSPFGERRLAGVFSFGSIRTVTSRPLYSLLVLVLFRAPLAAGHTVFCNNPPKAPLKAAEKAAVLAQVDAEQGHAGADAGLDDPDGRIRLMAISPHYAHASAYAGGSFGPTRAVDGNPATGWAFPTHLTEAWIEVSLGKSTPIHRIVLTPFRGTPKSHRVEYHDEEGWKLLYNAEDFAPAGRTFPTVRAGALRITLEAEGGGGLSEIGVYRDLQAAEKPGPDVTMNPRPTRIGTSMTDVAFSSVNPVSGDNTSAWLRFLEVTGVRTWFNANRHVPASDLRPGSRVEDLPEFDRRRAAVRRAPRTSGYIHWEALERRASEKWSDGKDRTYTVDDANRRLVELGLSVLCEINVAKWDASWDTAWRNWLTIYAWVFHQARTAGVCRFQYANEPETFYGSISPAVYVRSLQIHADAIRSAVEDVNGLYGTALKPVFSAPVLASSGTSELARLMMRNLRTDYRGQTVGQDLVHWFNKHRYGPRPRAFAQEIAEMTSMMTEESPTGQPLPIIYSEFNFSTGAVWARPESSFTSDWPEVFCSQASTWGLATLAGAKAFYQFKFADSRIKGNNLCTTLVREKDPGSPPGPPSDIAESSRNAEVTRLFARGFSGERPLLDPGVRSADPNLRPLLSRDHKSKKHFLWLVQPNARDAYSMEFDSSGLGLPAGTFHTITEVSAGHFGNTIRRGPLSAANRETWILPPSSTWLVSFDTVPRRSERVFPLADAEVVQGSDPNPNLGLSPRMVIARGPKNGSNHIAFLRFPAPPKGSPPPSWVFLRLHGRATGLETGNRAPFTCLVYGSTETSWSEHDLHAGNAPGIERTVSAVSTVDLANRPVGHLCLNREEGDQILDVTAYLADNPGKDPAFIVIREKRSEVDAGSPDRGELSTKEDPNESRRPYLEYWY